jgi:hypothetical protein
MQTQFHFKNMTPEPALRFTANATLDRILAKSPYGARAVAILEPDGESFRCALDIYSPQGPFMASAVGPTPLQVLRSIEARIGSQIEWWRAHRGMAASSVSGPVARTAVREAM